MKTLPSRKRGGVSLVQQKPLKVRRRGGWIRKKSELGQGGKTQIPEGPSPMCKRGGESLLRGNESERPKLLGNVKKKKEKGPYNREDRRTTLAK